MKKKISFLLAVFMLLVMTLPVYADATLSEKLQDGTTIVYETDGSRTVISPAIVVSRTEPDGAKASGSVTSSKPVTHYNAGGGLDWKYTLTATFTYNGTTSFCTSASYNNTINAVGWSFSNGSATRSGNTATGKGTYTFKILGITTQTVPVNVTLTCDENGNVS